MLNNIKMNVSFRNSKEFHFNIFKIKHFLTSPFQNGIFHLKDYLNLSVKQRELNTQNETNCLLLDQTKMFWVETNFFLVFSLFKKKSFFSSIPPNIFFFSFSLSSICNILFNSADSVQVGMNSFMDCSLKATKYTRH